MMSLILPVLNDSILYIKTSLKFQVESINIKISSLSEQAPLGSAGCDNEASLLHLSTAVVRVSGQ